MLPGLCALPDACHHVCVREGSGGQSPARTPQPRRSIGQALCPQTADTMNSSPAEHQQGLETACVPGCASRARVQGGSQGKASGQEARSLPGPGPASESVRRPQHAARRPSPPLQRRGSQAGQSTWPGQGGQGAPGPGRPPAGPRGRLGASVQRWGRLEGPGAREPRASAPEPWEKGEEGPLPTLGRAETPRGGRWEGFRTGGACVPVAESRRRMAKTTAAL